MIIPSIDLSEGKAVQLVGGERKVLEREDVTGLAESFARFGEVAVIDIDAARGTGSNSTVVEKLCKIADCRVGGGIRDEETARRFLRAGAKKLILGTAATPALLSRLPKDSLIVALDVRGGEVLSHGWRSSTGVRAEQKIKETEEYCSGYLLTAVEKEGRLEGTDWELIENVRKMTSLPLTVAGGFATLSDIKRAHELGCDVQLGMALYTNKIDLVESFVSLIKFDPLVPTVVSDREGNLLMLAYSSQDSLKEALKTGCGVYFSRSRNSIWKKGETSSNTQKLLRVFHDCDSDALLFIVEQKGDACHKGKYSCFGERKFTLNSLHRIFKERVESQKEGSYTLKLLSDKQTLGEKIREEAEELVKAETAEEVRYEAADVLYFTAVKLFSAGVSFDEVLNELRGRQR
ncbi:MAG: phosphoribosyl-ATP diphosphatase [Planctomycetota bacterium]|nr:phosphoribosyl-ATP diphosphatase [Planctomycetota bacterium]